MRRFFFFFFCVLHTPFLRSRGDRRVKNLQDSHGNDEQCFRASEIQKEANRS